MTYVLPLFYQFTMWSVGKSDDCRWIVRNKSFIVLLLINFYCNKMWAKDALWIIFASVNISVCNKGLFYFDVSEMVVHVREKVI